MRYVPLAPMPHQLSVAGWHKPSDAGFLPQGSLTGTCAKLFQS